MSTAASGGRFLDGLQAALREPASLLLDPGERTYWLFLLSTAALVLVLHVVRRSSSATIATSLRALGHRSAWLDYQLVIAKAGLRAALFAGGTLSAFGLATELVGVLDGWFGPEPLLEPSPLVIALVYTVVLFVAWDLSRFALHWAMHRVALLWEFHQVHHSAEVLTPFTLYRSHPVESLLYGLRGVLVTGLVTGVFFHLFRADAVALELFGVNALGAAFNALGGNLRHSHVWWSWGRLERWFISPAQHQLHHAVDGDHQNLGTWLSLWDRLAGTLRRADGEPPRRFGLAAPNHDPHRLLSALWRPVVTALGRLPLRSAATVGTVACCTLVPRPADAAPAPEETVAPAAPADADVDVDVDAPEEDAAPGPDPDAGADEGAPAPTEPEAAPDATPPGDAAAPDAATPPSGAPTPDAPGDAAPPKPESEADPEAPAEDGDDGEFELEIDEDEVPDTPVAADLELGEIPIEAEAETLARVPGSAHAVTEEELDRQENDDVHRVLKAVPGVYVRGEDGYGLRPNIGFRGANSDRSAKLTLMEDGILLGPAPYAAPAAYYFPLMTRMVGLDVIKGPASIQYGPNTIGGAIDLKTREIPSSSKGAVDVGVGMRGYTKLHGHWGTSGKRTGILIEGVRVQTNGFKELDGGGPTGFQKDEIMLKARAHNDPGARVYHEGAIKAGFADETSYETYLGLSDEDLAATPYRRYAASQLGRMKWWRTQAEASYFVARGDLVDFEATLYRHDFDRSWRKLNRFRRGPEVIDVLSNPAAGQAAVYYGVLRGDQDSVGPDQALMIGVNHRTFVSQGLATELHVRPKTKWVDQDIEFGARLHNDSIRRDHTEDGHLMVGGRLVPEGTPREQTTLNKGAAVAGAFHLLDQMTIAKRLTLVPGARVEIIRTDFRDDLADASTHGTDAVFLPGGGAHLQVTRWLGLLAGAHVGFSPVAPGQPADVKPEKSINYEAGARVLHGGTRLEAIGFFNDYKNLTGECTFSGGCAEGMLGRQFNAGAVYVAGLEALAGHRQPLPRAHFIEANANYTFTWSRFRTTFLSGNPQFGQVERGDMLPYVPVHQVSGQVGAGGRIWNAYVTGAYVGEMRDIPSQGRIAPQERIPHYFVLDLSGRVWVTPRASIYSTLKNATAAQYMISRRPFGARPGMPISFMAGFKYDFG